MGWARDKGSVHYVSTSSVMPSACHLPLKGKALVGHRWRGRRPRFPLIRLAPAGQFTFRCPEGADEGEALRAPPPTVCHQKPHAPLKNRWSILFWRQKSIQKTAADSGAADPRLKGADTSPLKKPPQRSARLRSPIHGGPRAAKVKQPAHGRFVRLCRPGSARSWAPS